ncbi:MAG: membrane-bound PQQ-dependent dehydrogenase, glucose/quinate/shikimate family [Pseudomonadota bacterium]
MKTWPSRILALLLLAIGLAVAAGGVMLIALGGSAYYLIGGIAVALAGFWTWRRDGRGAWLYAAFIAVTVLWAIWEVGLDAWQLTARVFGPAVIGLLFALPSVRKTLGRAGVAAALVSLAGLLVVTGSFFRSQMEVAASGPVAKVPIALTGNPGEWPVWGRDDSGTRFSPLTQITPANVGNLKRIWQFDTGIDPLKETTPSPMQATPLMVDGRLYFCTQTNVVFALDPDTGKQVWRFDPKVDGTAGSVVRTCRGVSYHDGAPGLANGAAPFCARRIITATFGAQLIALDSQTGKPCPTFGQGGFVDLKEGQGEVLPGFYYVSSAPAIVRGTIVVGGWVADNIGTNVPSGVIRGYDLNTGKLRWAWDAGNPTSRTSPPPGQWYTRATPNSWAPMSVDAQLGLVYIPTGNPNPDHFGGLRSPASLKYGSSVVALDATSGDVRWSFQTAHNDLWDYDVASQPTLFDFPGPNGPIPALAQPTKRSELFILDRRTGKPLTQVAEKPVATAGAVPEERPSPTQPFSVGMPDFSGGRVTERMMWGMTPLDQLWCRIRFRQLRYDGPATPPGLKESLIWPSIGGGMNWGGVSYDPVRRLMLVTTLYYPTLIYLVPRAETDRLIAEAKAKSGDSHATANFDVPQPQAGTPYGAKLRGFTTPLGTLCTAPPYGRITAVDMTTQKIRWQRPVGTMRDSGPLGLKSGLPIPMGMPGFGGSLMTQSGLTFFGAQKERTFRAFSTETGKELWSARMPASGNANPMTYLGPRSGRQFVVVAATGHVTSQSLPLGRTIEAYALPENGK